MRYHFFLHYGWFFQNLEKDFIPILLHTTVGPIYYGPQLRLILQSSKFNFNFEIFALKSKLFGNIDI